MPIPDRNSLNSSKSFYDILYPSTEEDSTGLDYSGTTKTADSDTSNAYQQSAIASNTGSVSDIAALTKSINDILQTGQFNANYSRIPGEYNLETQSSSNISDALAGKLGQDEINLLQQQAAERGVSSGSPLGASTDADYLRALGLTSAERKNTGQQWLTAATGRNPAAQTMDPTTMLVTPAEQARETLAEEELALKQPKSVSKITYGNTGTGGTGWYSGSGSNSGGSSTSGFGGTNNLWSLLNESTRSTGTGTGYLSSYNPDTWYNWENEMWNTPSEYYDVSGLTDYGGSDFLDWAGDYYA